MPEAVVPDYTALEFPPAPPGRPYVMINMVSSVDGKTTIEGTERGLGTPADQRLMRELRVHADVVCNGASTFRASGTTSRVGDPELEALRTARGKSPNPIAAVLSGRGDLPLERAFFTARDFDAVVYVSDAAPPERVAALEGTGRTVVTVPRGEETPAMLRHMYEQLGARMLLVEGGASINGDLFDRGYVDEFFLTLGPIIVAGNGTLTAVASAREPSIERTTPLEVVSCTHNPATQELYLRYRVQR